MYIGCTTVHSQQPVLFIQLNQLINAVSRRFQPPLIFHRPYARMATFIASTKGNDMLHLNGYKYRCRRRNNQTAYWSCVTKSCKSTAKTIGGVLQGEPSEHSDDCRPNENRVHVESAVAQMKQRMEKETTSAKRVYEDVASEMLELEGQSCATELPGFHSLERNLYRARHREQPTLSQSIGNIELPGDLRLSRQGDRFFLAAVGEGDDRQIIFATDANLAIAARCDRWFVDGTFKSTPALFLQVYTLHAMPFDGVMIPLVYGLLPNKRASTYRRFFELLIRACSDRGHVLNVRTITMDFEISVREALSVVLPQVTVIGCHFHFCQCLNRKVQNLGMAREYQDNVAGLRDFVRKLGSLALVPLHSVNLLFQELRDAAPQLPAVPLLLQYFEQQWLHRWTPEFWNVYDTEGAKTNNHLEGFHHKLNSCFNRSHPSVYTFVKEIKRLQATYELRILQASNGIAVSRPNPKYKHCQDRLRALKNQYERGQMTTRELLAAVVFATGL